MVIGCAGLLYEPVHNQLSKFCRAISGNSEDGEDLLQDTILSSLEGFNKIKDKNVFKSYLFSVASNLQKMKLRRLKFKAEFNDKEINQFLRDLQYPVTVLSYASYYIFIRS
jgi:RNA polymerase sigma factor (sigma-70 family)